MHRAVLDAVIAHNPEAAEKAIIVLIDGAREDIEHSCCHPVGACHA
jgi:DNA-binding GntR family transcriptional regulator